MAGAATTPVEIPVARIVSAFSNVQGNVNPVLSPHRPRVESAGSSAGIANRKWVKPSHSTLKTSVPASRADNASRDEATSDMFRNFASAVMAMHQPMTNYGKGMNICQCGAPVLLCDYTRLAKELLNSPVSLVSRTDAG